MRESAWPRDRYMGDEGGLYRDPGGGASTGPGGVVTTGPGGRASTGPGGGLYTGSGGGAYGAALQDVQDAIGHAHPRTTRRYDRSRHNLDRSPNLRATALTGDG